MTGGIDMSFNEFQVLIWLGIAVLIVIVIVLLVIMLLKRSQGSRPGAGQRPGQVAGGGVGLSGAGAGPSAADELAKLADLHSRGALTDDEYAQQKEAILRRHG